MCFYVITFFTYIQLNNSLNIIYNYVQNTNKRWTPRISALFDRESLHSTHLKTFCAKKSVRRYDCDDLLNNNPLCRRFKGFS